jgi:hypothetical protein
MKTLGWLILGGGVLYLLDEMGVFGTTAVAAPATSTSPQANTSTSVSTSNTSASTTTGAVSGSTLSQLITLMQQYNQDPTVNQYSAYVYGTYYNMLKGCNSCAPDPNSMWPGYSTNPTNMSISTWWAAASATGISGLGIIARNVNPYLQGPRWANKIYGANLAPIGPETMVTYRSNY